VGQILLNFLSNAEKFTKRGSILLRGRMINTGAEENLVMFEVKDSGSGISAALLPHLFDPFVQEDASTTRKHGGTGLGLAISKRLAQKMGGDIGVDTVLGQGSTFWFKLRLTPARSTHASPAPPLSRCNIKRALIVDDLAITRLALARLMTGLGIQTEVVASGEMALTTLAEWDATPEPFDLVIIDRNLEGINGLETCRRMRNQNLHSQPAALLITSTTDLHLAEDATAVGFGAVLQKPLTRQSLLEAFNLLEQGGHHAAARALPPSPAELMLARERRGSRILLVEDNLINQEVAKELLEEVGCQVDLAENGVQAIESAKANSYDLILMDLQMPLMDGVAATKAIRANEQTTGRRVPIIAMTANVFVDDRLRCLEAGVDDHVGKPFDPQTLFSRLLQWLPSRDVVPTPLIESRLESSAMDNAEARALLEAVPGFDLEAGLQVVRGRFPSYLNLLRKFLALHEGTMGTFRRLRADGQPVEALRLAHSLIGAAGFLGASRVSEAARNLEKAIHDQLLEAEILEKAAALEKELTVFCAAIRSLPPGVLAPASPMNLHS
jgi:CheY-like chemotaxis protein